MVVPGGETRVTGATDSVLTRFGHGTVARSAHHRLHDMCDHGRPCRRPPPGPAALAALALVTETYPPEVNGVAATLSMVVDGLRRRHHDLQLVRPRQPADEPAARDERFHEVLTGGLPIPRYSQMRMGVPRTGARQGLDAAAARRGPHRHRRAARLVGLAGGTPARPAGHVGLPHQLPRLQPPLRRGWLHRPIMAYLRRFHNDTQCTMVPSEGLRRELAAAGFERLTVVGPRRRHATLSPGAAQRRTARPLGSVAGRRWWCCAWAAWRRRRTSGRWSLPSTRCARMRPTRRLVLVGDGPARAECSARCPEAVFAGIRTGERPGGALRVGRRLPVPEHDRDLRQCRHGGDGQRPAGGGLRPCGCRSAAEVRRQRHAGAAE